MTAELKIEIESLPEATAKVLLWLAETWGTTPAEAARRLLNEEARRLDESRPAESRPAA